MDSRFSRVEINYFDFPVPDRTLDTVMTNRKDEYHEGYVPVSSTLLQFTIYTYSSLNIVIMYS
jgi:hypothetical protein